MKKATLQLSPVETEPTLLLKLQSLAELIYN